MGNFFNNVWSAISLLAWSDWLTLIILVIFIIRGFIQGLAKEIISFIFVIFAIILAWLYYDSLAKTFLSNWISADNQSIYALSFGGIFFGIWFIKKGLYRLARSASHKDNPNDLNRPFALTTIFTITGIVSLNYVEIIANFEIIKSIIVYEPLRNFISFSLLFMVLMLAIKILSKILNIKIDTQNTSIMSPIYKSALKRLSSLDTIINAKNISGLKNKIFGAILGLFKGGIFVLIIVLVLQSMTWVTQNHAWVETSGALRTFQDWSVDIKPVLSEHLLFVELEPGDAVVEFIESEILKE